MIPRKEAERQGFDILNGPGDGREALVSKLASLLPGAITEDGRVDVAALRKVVGREYVADSDQKHELRFAGRGVADHLADSLTGMELKTERRQSRDFDAASNVVIRGDNLDVLKILRKNYSGSVKTIYIDPPYNTGKDDFVYNDYFKKSEVELIDELGLKQETVERFQDLYGTKTHSGWLAFMYPRLKVAKDLLSDEGAIFISIDDHEHANLKLLCDYVFHESNFVGNIVWEGGVKNDSKFLSVSTDYILVYAKNQALLRGNHTTWRLRKEGINKIYGKVDELKSRYDSDYAAMTGELREWYGSLDKKDAAYSHKHYKSIDERGVYFPSDISWPGGGGPRYEVLHPGTGKPVKIPKRGWVFSNKNKMDRRIADGMVEFGPDETTVPQFKRYLHETEGQVMPNVIYKDRRYAKKALDSLLAENVFDDPKDASIIEGILRLTTQESDVVLDFFAGSGTTGEAIMKLNTTDGGRRRFILVQADEEIKEKKKEAIEFCKKNRLKPVISSITLERLKRAGDIIKKEHPDTDVGYKVFSLKPKPEIVADESQTLLSTQHTKRSANDTLFNMLCATGKPLDTPVKTVVKGKLYEADGEMYVLGDADLSEYMDRKINVDGWGETTTLEQYLNLPHPDNVEIVY